MSVFDFNPDHTDWCARDHRCGTAGEHRAESIVVHIPGHGRAALTRARTADGREYAELHMRIPLRPVENHARRQLHGILSDLRDLVTRAATITRPASRHSGRRAA
ncbi:hypothetical protein [Phytohabitans houttuyneae]|uniref:Uncharacterized protein n=1 Tax=Phytohabitans houttuyneae TaxID=1076126 RepID=A0A6V8KCS3_9ACTN|nr:hypothetical protein [Phytohabitans houttuyneae]GFJ79806.1 hypothetical protein Phou_039860 [Phytohabitans houttuyneae]